LPRSRHPVGAEIDLIPVLSTIVHIIPIALIAVRFVTLHQHEVDVPPVEASEAPSRALLDAQDNERVVVRILSTGLVVRGSDDGEVSLPCVAPCEAGDYDYAGLNALMVRAKARHPSAKQVVVAPAADSSYETIIGVFDAVTATGTGKSRQPLFPEPVLVDGAAKQAPPVVAP